VYSIQQVLGFAAGFFLLSLSVSCTTLQPAKKAVESIPLFVSAEQDGTLLAQFAPVFILEDATRSYNRIGTPTVRKDGSDRPDVYVDPNQPTIYSMEKPFQGKEGNYTNLIYRIHFEKTPLTHLTGGKNVGLLVVITLDQDDKPLLITTIHTCGCYLAFTPTSSLSDTAYPKGWSLNDQNVYGERLPGLIVIKPPLDAQSRYVFRIRSETHRVMGLDLLPAENITSPPGFVAAPLKPMADLRKLPFGDSKISFFETEGARKGYVRNSHKPLERLLMSWWAMDWRIGEDKDLGPSEETGTVFYTSIKFWAREESDLWDFAAFLEYWGWEL